MKNTVLLHELSTMVFSNLEDIGGTSNKRKKLKQSRFENVDILREINLRF